MVRVVGFLVLLACSDWLLLSRSPRSFDPPTLVAGLHSSQHGVLSNGMPLDPRLTNVAAVYSRPKAWNLGQRVFGSRSKLSLVPLLLVQALLALWLWWEEEMWRVGPPAARQRLSSGER